MPSNNKTEVQSKLITPYGGSLVDLLVKGEEKDSLVSHANTLQSIQISERSLCDLELLATGGFSPLDRFMNQSDYESVLNNMRLSNGNIFPIPITLPVNKDDVEVDSELALRDAQNRLIATINVEEIYEWDLKEVSQKVFGTLDTRHPMVAEMESWGKYNISGELKVVDLPSRIDFKNLRLTPAQTRDELENLGHSNVVAFQTRNPLHRVHEELTRRAASEVDGTLLIHPVVGLTKPGDVDHFTRVRTYKALTENHYEKDRVLLSLLPLAMRMGGPREALWHALIRRNFGANHFIVGRDHAGPGNDSSGNPFYGPYDAQDLVEQYSEELGVSLVQFSELAYLKDEDRYEEVAKIPEGAETLFISGTQVREDYLQKGIPLPEWFTRPEVAKIMAETYPPKHEQGICIWFTGLSGAGKSATADILTTMLMEYGRRTSILDGDVVRTHLSKGLGFSKEDRDTNILRIGYVASQIVSHGGLAICAAISPYQSTRDAVRNMVGTSQFIEVFVDTPLNICEARDAKGMYAKARRGEITGFTGIDDPYESPNDPEIKLNTEDFSAIQNAQQIIDYLISEGFILKLD